MSIGEAAKASGISAKMTRHNEAAGLFAQPVRSQSGYRQYSGIEINTLRFIRCSRDLGFSVEQIRQLLQLWQNRQRPCREVKALAQSHIDQLNDKLNEIQAMKATLQHLVTCCH